MITQNIYEAKANLSYLINKALAGEDVFFSKSGVPVAQIIPLENKAEKRTPGGWEGKVKYSKDFDEYDKEIAKMFENSV